jgi:hypothetical protein
MDNSSSRPSDVPPPFGRSVDPSETPFDGPTPSSERSFGTVAREVLDGVSALVRSEIRLAKAETSLQAKRATRQFGAIGTGAVLAWLGAHAFVAFAILALGRLFNDNYILSSLIVTLLLVVPGLLMALGAIKRLKSVDRSLTDTTASLDQDQLMIQGKIRSLKTIERPQLNLRKEKLS